MRNKRDCGGVKIMGVQKLFRPASVIFIFALPLFAQSAAPLPAPDDLILHFGTEGDQRQFYLGELIPIQFSYNAEVQGKYILVSRNERLSDGHGLEISCSPPAEPVHLFPESPAPDKFREMLLGGCGIGMSGGFAGSCEDCDSEWPLGPSPVSFGLPLNSFVRFRTAGTYTCVASSADVTTAPRSEQIRSALLVKSKAVVLNVVEDPIWAHSAAVGYANSYEKLCQGDDVTEHRSLECFDVAQRITYLDTPDSVAVEVKLYDGRHHGWDNGFWTAIQHTSHPKDALRLMTDRIQDSDFAVSTTILESLPEWELKLESPDAFQTAPPAVYHSMAVEKLRKYVRLLGSSLVHKNSNVLQENANTYRSFAEQEYCEQQALIPQPERQQILAAAGIRP